MCWPGVVKLAKRWHRMSVHTRDPVSRGPSPHHSLTQHPLITSTFNGPSTSTHCTAIFRPVLDSSLNLNFSLARSSISCALDICDGVTCHQPRCLQRTFLSPLLHWSPSRHQAINVQISAKRGKFYCSWQTLSHRDNDSQSINAETKISHSTKKKLINQL